jgi:hypothetical protein
MRSARNLRLVLGFLALSAGACASSGTAKTGSKSSEGAQVIRAVVTERQYDAPGSPGGGSYRSSGSWYLSFEAQEGDKTVHYRFPVTRQQYFRYPEGTRVELLLHGNLLREIRSVAEK